MKMEQQLTSGVTPITSLEEYATTKRKLNSLVTKFYQSIEDLENTGVVLKGLDENVLRISALASKKSSNNNNKKLYYIIMLNSS